MNILHHLFTEKCPTCGAKLTTDQSNTLFAHVIKSCPSGHYVKEFHPALETYVEYRQKN